MTKEIYRAESRGGADHGWLKTRHTFSFAHYYDPSRMGFGVLRVINDDAIAPATGFGRHPHSNMEIITIPLAGAVTHGDSMGNQGKVRAGEVQIMSAGSGVVHSEENRDPEAWLRLFQIWIETAPAYRNIEPRYKQKAFAESERKNAWQLLVSPPNQSELDIMQEVWIWRAALEMENQKLDYVLKNERHGVFVMIIEGEAEVAGETLKRRDALALTGVSHIVVSSVSACDILLLEVPLEN